MADILNKAISANNINMGTITVKANGANRTTSFKYDAVSRQVNPDGSSTTYWENKLTSRFDDPQFYTN